MKRPLYSAVVLSLAATLGLAAAASARDDGGQSQLDRLVGLTMRSGFLRQAAVSLLDDVGPRVAGTPNGRRAEDLAVETFRSAGLPLVRRETFSVPHWQVSRASLTLVVPTEFSPTVVPLANSASTPPQGLLLPVVDGGFGSTDELSALGEAVRGSALLVRQGAPPGGHWMHRSEKYENAVEAGAAAFLYTPDEPGQPMRSGTVTLSGAPGPIPALSIPAVTGDWFTRLLARGTPVKVRVLLLADRIESEAANVVADLPGREPDEQILVGAHLDCWDRGQGAGDNGTGTLVMWQAARTLVEQGIRPRRTIRFVSFMGEELGLLGSNAYAERHRDELASVRAMVNLDMEGEPLGFSTMLQPQAAPFLAALAHRLVGFGLGTEVPDRPGLHSDHQAFLLAGVPIVGLRSRLPQAVAAAYHSSEDTYDKLDLGQLQRAAAVTAALLWRLADEEELPTVHHEPSEVEAALESAGLHIRQLAAHREVEH